MVMKVCKLHIIFNSIVKVRKLHFFKWWQIVSRGSAFVNISGIIFFVGKYFTTIIPFLTFSVI